MKRCKAVSYIPGLIYASDGVNIYGVDGTQVTVGPLTGPFDLTAGHDFGAGTIVGFLWCTDDVGEVFARVEVAATDQYSIWRSADSGLTFSSVYTHDTTFKYILDRGFTVGYPGGVRTLAMAEYYIGGVTPLSHIITSTDGVTWAIQASITSGVGSNIRHMHVIRWNTYNSQWYIGSGDADEASMVLTTADLSTITNDTPTNLALISGINVAHGAQRHRVIDLLFTPEHVYGACDTLALMDEKGIWRWNHDMSGEIRVDQGDARYETGSSRGTMWYGLKHDGHLLFVNDLNTSQVGASHYEVYMAEADAADQNEWREVARVYVREGETGGPNGLFAVGNLIFYSFSRGAGKGSQGETAVFELAGTWQDDYLRDSLADVSGFSSKMYVTDTIHPVFWADPVNGSDANEGFTPEDAFATVRYALEGTLSTGTIATISLTEASGVATGTTGSAHGFTAGQIVTLAGYTPAYYNRTFKIQTVPITTTFTLNVVSGTGNAAVQGTVDDKASAMPWGSKLILMPGTFEEDLTSRQIGVNIENYSTNRGIISTSAQHGYEGEIGQPVTVEGAGAALTDVVNAGNMFQAYFFTFSHPDLCLIFQDFDLHSVTSDNNHQHLLVENSGIEFWFRDMTVGRRTVDTGALVLSTGCDTICKIRRSTLTCLGSGGEAVLEIRSGGGTGFDVESSVLWTAYRCVTAPVAVDGWILRMRGNAILGYASTAGLLLDNTNTNATGEVTVVGNVFVSGNGTTDPINTYTNAFSGGHHVENNFYEQTPTVVRDRNPSNVDMQVLLTALTDYFVNGDPEQGLIENSPLFEKGGWGGAADYIGVKRKNPSAMGHLEKR
jgi:hypothetical protein